MAERVVVLGGGLAGVACARQLGDDGIEVTLVDRNDYHQFQPLLYQVASSQLPAEDIARPHRTIFREYPSVDVVTAQVAAADLSTQSHTRRREDVAGVAPGDGSGCSAELLRGVRRRRVRLSAVFGG
jgi:NADH dehydrogenase FAD-containing subunit